jgi:glutaredoxin
MKLSPFVFQESNGTVRNSQGYDCFDESSPCVLEQLSECVIMETNQDQQKYVPWLICMDTDGENKGDAAKCSKQLGIDYSKVSECQKTQGKEILQKLVKQDANVNQTPTVFVNGVNIGPKNGPDYKLVKAAICKDDPSLKGCSEQDLLVV